MQFNRFRLVVTILAAFAAFFAYLCRLNLSLTIEEMCAKNDLDCGQGAKTGPIGHLPEHLKDGQICAGRQISNSGPPSEQQLAQERAELARSLLHLNNEEQTMAQLSAGWLSRRRTAASLRSSQNAANKTIKQIRESLKSLAVEFNINRPLEAPNEVSVEQKLPDESTKDNVNIEKKSQQDEASETPLLNWSKSDRNDLLGAFFTGYVIFQIPAGRAAELFGAKILFLWLSIGTGLSSLIFPMASKCTDSIWLAYAVRLTIGASQAGLFPACYVLLCQWLPKKERSSWLAVPSAMGRIGTIAMNLIVPIIMRNYGWEMVFYVGGCLTLFWGCLFVIFGSDSPATSNWISDKELMFIEARMEPRVGQLTREPSVTGSGFTINEAAANEQANNNNKGPSISWWKLVSNRPLLIMTLVMFTSEWSNLLLLVKLPGFLGPALSMDLGEIGMWSSILVGVYCVQYPLSGVLASRLEAAELDGWHSLRVRKLFEAAAHILQALGCLVIAFTSNKAIVLMALFVIMLGRSTVGGGQCLMPPELSKDYPGTVMAVANSIANSAGIVGPKIVTWLVDEPTNYDSWRTLWLLSAGIFTAGGAIFCLLAENEPQNYSKKPKRRGPATAISQAQLFPSSAGSGGGGGGGDGGGGHANPQMPTLSMNPAGRQARPATGKAKRGGGGGDEEEEDVEAATRRRDEPIDEQAAKMDAFSRLGSEPPRFPPKQLT